MLPSLWGSIRRWQNQGAWLTSLLGLQGWWGGGGSALPTAGALPSWGLWGQERAAQDSGTMHEMSSPSGTSPQSRRHAPIPSPAIAGPRGSCKISGRRRGGQAGAASSFVPFSLMETNVTGILTLQLPRLPEPHP